MCQKTNSIHWILSRYMKVKRAIIHPARNISPLASLFKILLALVNGGICNSLKTLQMVYGLHSHKMQSDTCKSKHQPSRLHPGDVSRTGGFFNVTLFLCLTWSQFSEKATYHNCLYEFGHLKTILFSAVTNTWLRKIFCRHAVWIIWNSNAFWHVLFHYLSYYSNKAS